MFASAQIKVPPNYGFAAGPNLLAAIRAHENERGEYCKLGAPRRALDCGAGQLRTAMALLESHDEVITLEEDEERATRINTYLDCTRQYTHGITMIYAPLEIDGARIPLPEHPHYPYQFFGELDTIVIDGPQGNHREGCLEWIGDLRMGGLVFVDDTHRPPIQALVDWLLAPQQGFKIIQEGTDGVARTWCALLSLPIF